LSERGRRSVTILIVDDEKEIRDLIAIYLENEGFEVTTCTGAEDALESMEQQEVELAILDVMMPDMDGFALLREIRRKWFFPVIMLTAKVQDVDKLTGLSLGADDYITKPFNPLELVARVKTQIRRNVKYNRAGDRIDDGKIVIRGLSVDELSHKCTLNGETLSLTPTEFRILLYLCKNQGKVVSSEDLFEHVWGEKYYESSNTVMAHIARLRTKMHEPSRRPEYIKTVWGVGYTIE
jgi:two-component system response regulator VanR